MKQQQYVLEKVIDYLYCQLAGRIIERNELLDSEIDMFKKDNPRLSYAGILTVLYEYWVSIGGDSRNYIENFITNKKFYTDA